MRLWVSGLWRVGSFCELFELTTALAVNDFERRSRSAPSAWRAWALHAWDGHCLNLTLVDLDAQARVVIEDVSAIYVHLVDAEKDFVEVE